MKPADGTARVEVRGEREREREVFSSLTSIRTQHSEGPEKGLTAQLLLGLILGLGEQGTVHGALIGHQVWRGKAGEGVLRF